MDIDDYDAKVFMEHELNSAGIKFIPGRPGNIAIQCPFHSHSGRQFKLEIKFSGKVASCWACRWGGTFNDIAEHFNMRKLPLHAGASVDHIKREINEILKPYGKITLPTDMEDWKGDWRGIPEEFLLTLNSKKWYDALNTDYRILWPVTYNGKLQGWTAGRLNKYLKPKYRNGPLDAFRAINSLFMIDHKDTKDTAVLVEGQFSAIRLLYEDIPAIAIFGTANWHYHKATMMMQRTNPIKKVIIAMDGDKEGEEAENKIYESIKNRFDEVSIFHCPKDRDPGDMDDYKVKELRNML